MSIDCPNDEPQKSEVVRASFKKSARKFLAQIFRNRQTLMFMINLGYTLFRVVQFIGRLL